MESKSRPLVFVSHSSEDVEFSHQLVSDLREEFGDEVEVWHDSSGGLKGGDGWWRVIVDKLAHCSVFLLVMSPAAQQSESVGSELDMAWTRKLQGKTRIIPLLYKPCEARLDLTTLQYVSFLPPKTYDHALTELVTALLLPTRDRTETHGGFGAPLTLDTQLTAAPAGRVLPHVVPTLLILSIANATIPRVVTIPGTSMTIGRAPDNDLVLEDASVSRHHLRLMQSERGWHVSSATEAGQLYVNGEVCSEAELRSGDQVVIGGTVLRFELPDPVAPHPASRQLLTIHTSATPPQLTVDSATCRFVVPLRAAMYTLGRAPDNGIVIPSPVVSTHHAALRRTAQGGYLIEDMSGQNGLTLLGQRIGQHVLQSGDTMLIAADMPGHSVALTYAALS